jgi:hypothetical protein
VASDSAAQRSAGPQTDEELERRQSPWRVLLLLALVALTLETVLATRGRRGTARRVVAQPSTRPGTERTT